MCAQGVDVAAVPLLELPVGAVDGHQQAQGDERRVYGENLLSISHNRRHPKMRWPKLKRNVRRYVCHTVPGWVGKALPYVAIDAGVQIPVTEELNKFM